MMFCYVYLLNYNNYYSTFNTCQEKAKGWVLLSLFILFHFSGSFIPYIFGKQNLGLNSQIQQNLDKPQFQNQIVSHHLNYKRQLWY